VVALLFVGCDSKPEAPRTGLYGSLTNAVGNSITRTLNDPSASQPWTNGALAVVESELSPATLYHANAATLSFFIPDVATGLGAPSYICFSTEQGPKIFKPGDKIDPKRMRESWFVVWWSGASGWTNWDAPFFLTLQHRPAAIEFTTNGLQLKFNGAAGFAAFLPLYGYDKSLPEAMQSHPFVQAREKKKRVFTWEWHKALPADPLARARYWASALREFPIACDETFSVDRAHDSVTIKQSFRWLSWNDDWNTKHVKLAPLSPVLALAIHEKFPAEFSAKPFDMGLPTRHGPLYGVQDVDSYEVTLPVLRYVHETLGVGAVTLWTHAPCYDAWVTAHGGESWDMIRRHWPTLRSQFLSSARSDWPAFASVNVSPLEQAANALGAARLAYRLGDAETYAVACARFARATIQLSAQQRGANYFREHQPWHSMEPMTGSMALSHLTTDGWQFTRTNSSLENSPDLARLLRAAQPMAKVPAAAPPPVELERLIPGHPATEFLTSQENASESRGLTARLLPAPAGPSLQWLEWKTATGAAWNFGFVSMVPNQTAAPQKIPLTRHSRAFVYTKP
jgi:hypothetical protein